MKEAVGYITEDGKFFEGIDEAEEYEAFNALRSELVEISIIEPELFMSVCSCIPNAVRRYINANEAATRYREIQASLSAKDNTIREADTQTVLKQPSRIDESLSNMGGSVVKEEI
jgi:hypothetical protein